jgi:branched-chain amino acid transport system permease protein
MLSILFDGVAYGMLLFVLAVGLSVTLGVMNVINLAHGTLAMAGGYVAVVLTGRFGVPFLAALPVAAIAAGLLGLVLEKTLYIRIYRKSALDQTLFTIGLVFVSVAVVTATAGSSRQFLHLPAWLDAHVHALGINMGVYRLLLIVLCGAIALALQLVLGRTRFGSQLRAAVDDRRTARGLGIRVDLLFTVSFTAGSALAGLGGALGAEVLGLDPNFPLAFLVYFLIVVAVGGSAGIAGPLCAAVLLGVADVAGKYYVPQFGAFIIYTVMLVVLLLRPQGLFAASRGAG